MTQRTRRTLVVAAVGLGLAMSCAPAAGATTRSPLPATVTDARGRLEQKALTAAAKASGKGKRLVADYNTPARQGTTPAYTAAQVPYDKVTDIIHVGITILKGGGLSVPSGFVEPDLVTKAHAAGDHVVLLVGGESNLVGHPKATKKATRNVARWVKSHHYDGVDLDWEYPSNKTERKLLVTLFTQLRHRLGHKAILSVDVAPWTVKSYSVGTLAHIVNWFNVMTYDCAGPWTGHGQLNEPILKVPSDPAGDECTPGQSDQESTKILLKAGARRHQLNQGTPFYGYWYHTVSSLYGACPEAATSSDGSCGDAVVTSVDYGTDVTSMLASGDWTVHRDPEGLVPYLLRTDGTPGFVTYDDPQSTYDRTLYSDWVQHLGGTFMWALEEGWTGASQPLLDAMNAGTVGKTLG